jgi:hypothetical protein
VEVVGEAGGEGGGAVNSAVGDGRFCEGEIVRAIVQSVSAQFRIT